MALQVELKDWVLGSNEGSKENISSSLKRTNQEGLAWGLCQSSRFSTPLYGDIACKPKEAPFVEPPMQSTSWGAGLKLLVRITPLPRGGDLDNRFLRHTLERYPNGLSPPFS